MKDVDIPNSEDNAETRTEYAERESLEPIIRERVLACIRSLSRDPLLKEHFSSRLDLRAVAITDKAPYAQSEATTAGSLHGQNYYVPYVDAAWMDIEWWRKSLGYISVSDVVLAIAYEYLLQKGAVKRYCFIDDQEAASYIYGLMLELHNSADFEDSFID